MCMVLDVPPVLEAQILDYEKTTGRSLRQMFLDYLQQEIDQNRVRSERVRRFRQLLAKLPKLEGEPYRFHRRDAYEEELG